MNLSKPVENRWVSIAISLFSIFLAAILSFTAVFQSGELKLLDWRFSLRGPRSLEDSPIVILAIDDQSDESTPERWPWPRSYFAHVIENLEEAGAAVIGVDVIFEQADKYAPEYDDELADVLSRYDNIVLTGKLLHGQRGITSVIPPYEKFLTPSTRWGLAAIEADMDGFYRRYLIGAAYNDTLLPSLAAQILQIYQGNDSLQNLSEDDDNFYIGKYTVPKYDSYSMLINFVGPAFSFPYYPFDNVLDDEDFDLLEDFDLDAFDDPGDPELGIPPGLKYSGKLKNKIILIGSTIQELHDNFATPFLEYYNSDGELVRSEMPGVEIHANALLTILENNYLKASPFILNLLIIILISLITYFITHRLLTIWGTFMILLLMAGYVAIAFLAFIYGNIILNISAPLFVALFAFSGHTVYSYLLTQQEKRMLRGAFSHYVPESVVEQIIDNPATLTLGGEEREISVMFSDVAGFTTISESLTPRELVALLNEYLTAMTDIILSHNGIIDKYEGDAIMAEFGVPVHYEGHAIAACNAALDMQKALKHMREEWAAQDRPQLRARVGINTGEVIVGNMGSKNVFDYTVMGDHVNLGSRLEGANKAYGTEIMISEFTYRLVKDEFYTRPLDFIRVKGKTKPIEVFELIATRETKLSSNFLELLQVFGHGIEAYRNRKWADGLDYFEHCLKLFPDDQPSAIYRQRCAEFRLNPPPAKWDGVITMKEK